MTSHRTSRLVGRDPERVRAAFQDAMAGTWPHARPIPLWDGKAASRISDILVAWLGKSPPDSAGPATLSPQDAARRRAAPAAA